MVKSVGALQYQTLRPKLVVCSILEHIQSALRREPSNVDQGSSSLGIAVTKNWIINRTELGIALGMVCAEESIPSSV